jgi:hypothetical protein
MSAMPARASQNAFVCNHFSRGKGEARITYRKTAQILSHFQKRLNLFNGLGFRDEEGMTEKEVERLAGLK